MEKGVEEGEVEGSQSGPTFQRNLWFHSEIVEGMVGATKQCSFHTRGMYCIERNFKSVCSIIIERKIKCIG